MAIRRVSSRSHSQLTAHLLAERAGKTVQILSFLRGAFDSRLCTAALILAPVSVLEHWRREALAWCPDVSVHLLHGVRESGRARFFAGIAERGGICLASYGNVVSCVEALAAMRTRVSPLRGRAISLAGCSLERMCAQSGAAFSWDYFILDEGHKIKVAPAQRLPRAASAL